MFDRLEVGASDLHEIGGDKNFHALEAMCDRPPQPDGLFTTYESHQLGGNGAPPPLHHGRTVPQPPSRRPEEERSMVKLAATLDEFEQGLVSEPIVANSKLPASAQLAAVRNVARFVMVNYQIGE